MRPVVAARPPRCRASTPVVRHVTRGCATRLAHPPSRRSSLSCAPPARLFTVSGSVPSLSCCGALDCESARHSRSPRPTLTRAAAQYWYAAARAGRRREVGMDDWAWEQLQPWLTRGCSFRWGRCSASSPALRAAGDGRSRPLAPSCATPPRPPESAAALPRTSCATLTLSNSPTKASRSWSSSDSSATAISASRPCTCRASTTPRSSRPSTLGGRRWFPSACDARPLTPRHCSSRTGAVTLPGEPHRSNSSIALVVRLRACRYRICLVATATVLELRPIGRSHAPMHPTHGSPAKWRSVGRPRRSSRTDRGRARSLWERGSGGTSRITPGHRDTSPGRSCGTPGGGAAARGFRMQAECPQRVPVARRAELRVARRAREAGRRAGPPRIRIRVVR